MSWITFDNLKRFWKGIRTNPVTFTGEIDLQNTTRYKGKEIATKADITDIAGQLDRTYAPKASPAFTGLVTATDVKVSTSLTIPGGKVWIE